MGTSFSRDSFPLSQTLLSFAPILNSLLTLPAILRLVAAARGGVSIMSKRERDQRQSSLPSSLIPHLYSRPQPLQGTSPTSSPHTEEDVELPPSPFDPSRQSTFPLRPVVAPPLPAVFSDTRRQYSVYDSAVIALPPVLDSGPATIAHASARRYRSPPGDSSYYSPVRSQGSLYPGSHSLPPPVPPTLPTPWREGEAGPSSLAPRGESSNRDRAQLTSNHPNPQAPHRRVSEYAVELTPIQHGFPSGLEYSRPLDRPLGFPVRPIIGTPYQEPPQPPQSRQPSATPAYNFNVDTWPRLGDTQEQGDLPPLYNVIRSQSSASSEFTRVGEDDDASLIPQKRLADEDFEKNPRRTKKVLVACKFCRGRKLRCDGLKPRCCNCSTRDQKCEYAPAPKRRGPGKAPKGSRTKKKTAKERLSESSSSQAAPGSADDFDLQTIAPELRGHASLDSGLHSLQAPSGRYASQQLSPERAPQSERRRPSRNMYPSVRPPSSEYEYSPPPEDGSQQQ